MNVDVEHQGHISRKLLLRALATFVTLVLVNGVVVGWLLFHDFEQRAVRSMLADSAEAAQRLSAALSREVAPAGVIDLVRIAKRRPALVQLIGRFLQESRLVEFVEVVDPTGRVVLRQRLDTGGQWQVQGGGAFGGAAPPNPDTPPAWLDVPQPPGRRSGPGALPRVVPVPLSSGAGALLFGVNAGPLEEEVVRLRRTLAARLLVGGGVSLIVLVVAFLYVVRLLQRTRRVEAEAQRAEQLVYLGTLASGLAHEIRNPLNAMSINLQLLEEELGEGRLAPEAAVLLRSARNEVLRLEQLVKDFLAFARPQIARRVQLAPAELVADVVRFIRPLFEDAGVQLEFAHVAGAPAVWIDPAQIRQALLNILRNALEASSPGARVSVEVGPTIRGEAQFEVRDQGPGIAADIRPLIFEVFWSKKPAGSGLGLPIAKRAVEAHGGRIEVDSTAGAGSVFRIVLPAAVEAAPAPPAGPAGAAA